MVTVSERRKAPLDVTMASPHPAWPWRVVLAATTGFILVFGWLVLSKHALLGTRAFDLAIFDQGLWLLSKGQTPFVTVRGLHLFADHTSFLLFPLVPLYWIWADVRVLLIVTVVALAAGGPLVYAAARAEGLSRRIAAALGVGYLLVPALHWQIWDVFHPETLVIPMILAAYVLALRRRPGWALAMLAVVLLAKEDAALIVIPVALYLGFRTRKWWLAAAGAAIGVAALVIAFGVLLPHWSPTGEPLYSGRYTEFGDSFPEIVWGVLTSPIEVLRTAFRGMGLVYLAGLIVPVLLSLLAPGVLLTAGPILLANLLSRHHYQAELRYHYTAYIIPVVVIAAIVGTRRLLRWSEARPKGGKRWRVAASGTAGLCILVGSFVGGPWGHGSESPWAGSSTRPELAAEALAVVPPDAAVSGDSRTVPHLAHRQSIYVFPNPLEPENWSAGGIFRPPADDFDWIVVRTNRSAFDEETRAKLDELIDAGTFVPVLTNDELTVFRRASTIPSGSEAAGVGSP